MNKSMDEQNERNEERTVPEIIDLIKKGEFNPRLLDDSQLDMCIEHLYFYEGEYQYNIATLLKRHHNTISNHTIRILKQRADELRIRGVDVYELAQKLFYHTKFCMDQAKKDRDWRLYIDAYHKYIERLQSLGVVYKAPDQLQLNTLSGEEIAEIKNFMMTALRGYPEAREALAKAFRMEIDRNENGNST